MPPAPSSASTRYTPSRTPLASDTNGLEGSALYDAPSHVARPGVYRCRVKPSRRDFLRSSIMVPGSAALAAQRRRAAPPRVAVVGAGAFGGWTALHLRRAGADVTLIDAWGRGNSRASSGGETRVIRTIYGPTRRYVEMAARAFTLWREWDRLIGEPFYRRTGVLWMTGTDDSYVRQSLPVLRDLKLEYEEIDPGAAAKRWPQVRFARVATGYLHQDGGSVPSRHACDAVARELVRIGGADPGPSPTAGPTTETPPGAPATEGTTLAAGPNQFAP